MYNMYPCMLIYMSFEFKKMTFWYMIYEKQMAYKGVEAEVTVCEAGQAQARPATTVG